MWYGWTCAEKDCISVSLLAYVYLDHGSSSSCGHGCISIVLSSLRIHMFGCAHVLQNNLISFLIRPSCSSSSINLELILSMALNKLRCATLRVCVKLFLNCFIIASGGCGK